MAEKLPKAPPNFTWVYNRLPRKYEAMFDFKLFEFGPNESRLMAEDVALFLTNNSVIKVDLSTSKGVRALVPQFKEDGKEHPEFGVPYLEAPGDEVIDRSTGDNPMQRGSGGLKTHAAKLAVQ